MRKRSNSRGSQNDTDNNETSLHAPAVSVNSGASSAPTTPMKTATGSTTKPKDEEIAETFLEVNARPVDGISLQMFYEPHTITLVVTAIICVMYYAFVRDESILASNIAAGILCVVSFFIAISVLIFPNGPFTRPHPAVWRMLFGCSILYLITLLFSMAQDHKTIMDVLHWVDPKLKDFRIDMDKDYGVNCSDISFERVKGHLDIFAWGHLFGWAIKAMIIRHSGILWTISVMWEITEISFAHLLPNFVECWWDALILDILVCNNLGIWLGLKINKLLTLREYKWASIKDISSTSGKIKRAMLQFTPGSWTPMRWLDPKSTIMRIAAVVQLCIFWQVIELNTFFLKHIFEMPPNHFLVIGRLLLIGAIVMPSVQQYYTYVTDTRCKRVGTQCWVFGAIMVSEAMLCIKNGKALFAKTKYFNICIWLGIQIVLAIGFVCCSILYQRYQEKRKTKNQQSPTKKHQSKGKESPKHNEKIQ